MSEWIDFSKRLPDEEQLVITSGYLYGEKWRGRWVEPSFFFQGEFHPPVTNEDGDMCADLDATMNHATHWMPLPPPPAD